MEVSPEPTHPVNDGDALLSPSKKRLAENCSCRLLTYARGWPNKWPVFGTLGFLIGSITFIILSEVVQANRGNLGRIVSNDLNPSCTDFGNTKAEQSFALDIAYGNFTFTQAKVIDITWDTVVGQGGRLVHGWILCCCIIYPLLVLAMETYTVTYPYYATLSFSKASFETLVQLLKTLHITKSYSVLLCTILLIYTLAYTLSFSLIWGTATGYISLSHKLYAMPGGDIIPLNSGDLSLCWVLDPTKLGISTPHIEVGPNFSDILSTQRPASEEQYDVCLDVFRPGIPSGSTYNLIYDVDGGWRANPMGITIWDLVSRKDRLISENFMNIQNYALTRQFLQIGLDVGDWVHSGWETNLNESTISEVNGLATLNWFEPKIDSTKDKCYDVANDGLHLALRAVTLENEGQRPSTQDISTTVDFPPYNESALEKAYWSLFVLNQSVPLGPGIMPYNSTIQLNDTTYALDAPFLDVGFNCSKSSPFNSLGNCVCYKGLPISLDLLGNDRAICNTAPGYVWGFSSYLTRVGLILEAIWMACCFVAYPWLLYRSKLVHMEPIKSAKVMRLLLDCSEAVYNDIGLEAKDLHENEIKARLKNIKIGYHTDILGGELRYRIASGLTTKGFAERFSEADELLLKRLNEIDATFLKRGAQKLETCLDKNVSILNRVANHPVHDKVNKRVEGAIATWRSYLSSEKRRPTVNEVYEDVNWHFETRPGSSL